MLNKTGTRELVYLICVDDIEPIPGRDRVEAAVINGWKCMVPREQFHKGDIGIYFEVDSKVDTSKAEFAFLQKYNGKIKTQRYKNSDGTYFYSQGLLMALSDFVDEYGRVPSWLAAINCAIASGVDVLNSESRFLTKELGVTYADDEDNKRKANIDPNAKYTSMKARHKKIFSNRFIKKMMKYKWFREVMFFFFGKKKDTRRWPTWVAKTDEERVQNMPWILNETSPWIATEKIDGTSTTFTIKRGKFGKFDFYVCSRNVVFDKPDKKCFYDTNVYTEMAEKYHVEEVLTSIMKEHPEYDWITLQGETYGTGIQKRGYGIDGHDFAGFNFITSTEGRWNSVDAENLMKKNGIPWVPIITDIFYMPDTVDELLAIATGKSEIDGGMREGLVFRSQDGTKSFKAVSNEFLLKYHS